MSEDIRLYMFQCGTLECHVENIKMNQGLGDEYEIPVPWFLVTHPRGNVVIDGGNAAECATDPTGHWGATTEVYNPRMAPDQACVPALRDAGFDPADIAFILQSHLHLDHTGAVGALDEFSNAQVLATRAEYEYALAPDWFAAGAYIQADYNKPGVPWVLLEEGDN
jgi:N-acyl homoserine lactone hydrolase